MAWTPEKQREYMREYYAKNRERMNAAARENYVANRAERLAYVKAYTEENKDQVREYKSQYYRRNRTRILAQMRANYKPENDRRHHLRHTYGLTVEQWDAMFAAQDRRCAICRTDTSNK